MREKYTADAKETLVLAEKAASQAGCSYVGSEHILLGLLKGKVWQPVCFLRIMLLVKK